MSGSLIGAAIGVGLSFATGGLFTPAMGFMFGSLIGGILFPPAGPDGPRLDDLKAQSSEYGRPIPIVYGTMGIGGSVIWASDLVEVEGDAGGKGGSEASVYSYYGNFAVALCEGRDGMQLGRIWAGPDKRLIYDGTLLEGADSGALLRFYPGSETQQPDPLIESYEGVGNVEAFRGTAYLVLEHFPLAKDGNRLPFLTVEVGVVSTNTAPENLGVAVMLQEITTATYWATFYRGTYNGLIIRYRSDDTLYKHYTFVDSDWSTSATWFWDEDRQVFIRWTTGLEFTVMPITTGVQATHTISAAVGADSNIGTAVKGGVYHDGAYIFAAAGSAGQVDRVTLYAMDPASPDTPLWTYAANSGASGALAKVMKPTDPTALHVYCLSEAQTLTAHPLASAATPVSLGAPAPVSGTWYAVVDDNTGFIWTIKQNVGSIDVCVSDPSYPPSGWPITPIGQVYSATITFPGTLAVAMPIAFVPGTPNKAIIAGVQPVGIDYFVIMDADTPAIISQAAGAYHGTADVDLMLYQPTAQRLYMIRYPANVTMSDTPADPYTANLFIAPGFTQELDNWNLGAADATLRPQGELLSSILTDLHERAGLTAGQIGLTRLTDETVDGYALASQTTVRDAMTALMPAYFFDGVESDGKVEFVTRGRAIAVVIPDADVGCFEAGGEPPEAIETTRRMEHELPRSMNVRYLLAATNYSSAARLAKRLVGSSGDEQTLELPLVLSDTKAQEIAEVNLHGAWVARLSYSFTLPRKYGYLEPTDIIVVYGYTMRLTKTIAKDGIIQCEATHDDSNIYVPDVVVTETVPDPGTVASNADTLLELLDINMLRDSDDDAGFYVAACAADPLASWPGATLYHSSDSGATYSSLASITAEATMGYTTDVLGNFYGGNIPDELNSVNVVLTNGSLSSTTNAGLLSGVNLAVIGDEILHFRTATLESNGSYTLTGLLRGRRGSEYAMGTHAATDRFILVSTATMVRAAQTAADIGQTRLYKAVTAGSTLAATDSQSFTNTGNALKPYACTHLGGGRNAAGDATLSWSRRSRIDGAWRDGVDVPLGETSEAYEVEIYSDNTYATLKRTLTGISSESTTYSAANQTTDFGSPQSTIYFRVYQLSATVGRGHAADGSV